jgi:hypothetical protein
MNGNTGGHGDSDVISSEEATNESEEFLIPREQKKKIKKKQKLEIKQKLRGYKPVRRWTLYLKNVYNDPSTT